jgi:hypothetical protein
LIPGWAAEDSGARFSDLSGEVQVRAGDDEEGWNFAKLDMRLNVDDHVKTGDNSSAILSFADMTTFVMKPDSEIILSSPAGKDSVVKLLAGNLWVNVKKMVKDGSMDIEMGQAVAGIKGTNITCQTSENEDRIQVLRGLAEVLIRETQERVQVTEGEELVVKKGGQTQKTEIDVDKVNEEWKDQVSKLGANIQLEDIPDTIQGMLQSESQEFAALSDAFKDLLAATPPDLAEIMEFRKAAERFIGVIMEDLLILAAMRAKIDRELAGAAGDAAATTQLLGYQKMVNDAQQKIQGFQNEIAKMLKAQFKVGTIGDVAELERWQGDLANILEPVEEIMREVSARPTGISQYWFMNALDQCTEALNDLGELLAQVQNYLDQNPQDTAAQALVKTIGAKQTQISGLLKDLAVVEIDGAVLTELQQIDDLMSNAVILLNQQIDSYNTQVAGADAERRLSASLAVLRDFSKARRLFLNAQRLYDSIMRSTAGQKFRTAEQEEMMALFDRIQNIYHQVGIGAELLESRLNDLKSQLGQFLSR